MGKRECSGKRRREGKRFFEISLSFHLLFDSLSVVYFHHFSVLEVYIFSFQLFYCLNPDDVGWAPRVHHRILRVLFLLVPSKSKSHFKNVIQSPFIPLKARRQLGNLKITIDQQLGQFDVIIQCGWSAQNETFLSRLMNEEIRLIQFKYFHSSCCFRCRTVNEWRRVNEKYGKCKYSSSKYDKLDFDSGRNTSVAGQLTFKFIIYKREKSGMKNPSVCSIFTILFHYYRNAFGFTWKMFELFYIRIFRVLQVTRIF